jgi:hypothetical protein
VTPNDLLVAGYRMAGQLIHRMTDDLSPADFYHVPMPGVNCAAWVIGHLAITLRKTAERLDATVPMMSVEFVNKFRPTGMAAGEQADLGEPAELMKLFDMCLEVVIGSMMQVSPAKLTAPAPSPFGTLYGEAALFGTLHVAMHSGQLSLIRRSLGKLPVV